MTKNPICYILVGVPGSGKSTWIKDHNFDWDNTVIASTDDYIENMAQKHGKTYSEVFKEHMPNAVEYMANTVVSAVEAGKNIVWDQTSCTVASRAKKFRMLPRNYTVIAVVFRTPEATELVRRLASRPGKNIPGSAMDSMIASLVIPTTAEGFTSIIHVN